jgi:hypothetical protein
MEKKSLIGRTFLKEAYLQTNFIYILITYYLKYIVYLPYIYRLVFDHTSRSGRVLNVSIEQKMLNPVRSASNRCKQAQNEKRKNVSEERKIIVVLKRK